MFSSFFAAFFRRAIDFTKQHDPGNINLIYALKTFLSAIIGAFIGFVLFGSDAIVWGALTPISIYFLNVVLSEKREIFFYFFIFIVLSAIYVVGLSYIANNAIALGIALIILAFWSAVFGAYDLDLYRATSFSLLNGLIACIYVTNESHTDPITWGITVLLSGFIALLVFFFISLKRYKKFTQKHFPDLINELGLLVSALDKPKQFAKIYANILTQLIVVKKALDFRAQKIRSPNDSKNTKRALFYLYRIHDIKECLSTLHQETLITPLPKELFRLLKREIIYNLSEISKMIGGHIPRLRSEALRKMQDENTPISIINLIKIIYVKINTFRRSSQEEDYFIEAQPKRGLKIFVKTMKASMSLKNEFFQYGIKYALTLGFAVFVASFFNLNHGIWIVMACLYLMRPNVGELRISSAEYIFGAFLGLVFGLIFVYFLLGSYAFIVVFAIVLFLFIYFRVFPHVLWTCFSMMSFVMLFAIFNEDYFQVLNRLLDISIALVIVLVIFWAIYPKYGGSDFIPNVKKCLDDLYQFYGFLGKNTSDLNHKNAEFSVLQNDFAKNMDSLKISIDSAKTERKSIKNIKAATQTMNQLHFLHHNGLKIYYYLLLSPNIEHQKELFVNDLMLLQTRFSMLKRSLSDSSFYFKESEDGRFVSNDEAFLELSKLTFLEQNKLFLTIAKNH
ncbi:MAG: FUSC family protein [Helicobacter sp.]|nr:FUSC family protein [Helicobacter sp.]